MSNIKEIESIRLKEILMRLFKAFLIGVAEQGGAWHWFRPVKSPHYSVNVSVPLSFYPGLLDVAGQKNHQDVLSCRLDVVITTSGCHGATHFGA